MSTTIVRRAKKDGYDVAGEFYPSATTVLNVYPKYLDNWKLKLCREHVLEQFDLFPQGATKAERRGNLETWLQQGCRQSKVVVKIATTLGTEVHNAIDAYWKEQ